VPSSASPSPAAAMTRRSKNRVSIDVSNAVKSREPSPGQANSAKQSPKDTFDSAYAGASNAVNSLKRTPLQSAQPTFTPQKVSPEMSGISSWLSEPDLISSPGHSAPSSPGFAPTGFATGGSGPLMSAPCIGSPSNDRLMSSGSSAGSPDSVPSSPEIEQPRISQRRQRRGGLMTPSPQQSPGDLEQAKRIELLATSFDDEDDIEASGWMCEESSMSMGSPGMYSASMQDYSATESMEGELDGYVTEIARPPDRRARARSQGLELDMSP